MGCDRTSELDGNDEFSLLDIQDVCWSSWSSRCSDQASKELEDGSVKSSNGEFETSLGFRDSSGSKDSDVQTSLTTRDARTTNVLKNFFSTILNVDLIKTTIHF